MNQDHSKIFSENIFKYIFTYFLFLFILTHMSLYIMSHSHRFICPQPRSCFLWDSCLFEDEKCISAYCCHLRSQISNYLSGSYLPNCLYLQLLIVSYVSVQYKLSSLSSCLMSRVLWPSAFLHIHHPSICQVS